MFGVGLIMLLTILAVIVVLILVSCIRIVRQAQALVIERLGAYQATWSTGLHFKLPIVDRVAESRFKRTGSGFCTAAGDHKG